MKKDYIRGDGRIMKKGMVYNVSETDFNYFVLSSQYATLPKSQNVKVVKL